MNELEAINHINLMCESCSYWYNGKCHEDGNCFESMQMSIKALEKQIPKKPIDKIMYLECPACGDVGILDCGYCPVCGQKIDWQ